MIRSTIADAGIGDRPEHFGGCRNATPVAQLPTPCEVCGGTQPCRTCRVNLILLVIALAAVAIIVGWTAKGCHALP